MGKEIDVVAVVDVSADADYFAYLIKHDSVHGRSPHQVSAVNNNALSKDADTLVVNGHRIKCLSATKDQLEREALGWLQEVGYAHCFGPEPARYEPL